jgi:D-aminoacyl-tRNA deacylase
MPRPTRPRWTDVRLLVQRVLRAEVRRAPGGDPDRVDATAAARIGPGLLVLVGVAPNDGDDDVAWAAGKLLGLRVFADDRGKMNLDLGAVGGALLVVSQFTLYGDLGGGRRPGFSRAAPPDHAERLYLALVARLRAGGGRVETGFFGEAMQVESVNDGPVTLWLDSAER